MIKHHIFTKQFWNRSRILWVTIVGLCTSVPIVFGSLVVMTKWTEAKILTPYIECKVDAICDEREKPLKQDLKTMVNDMRFVRGCMELSTPKHIQETVIQEIKKDSILDNMYVIR